MISKVSHVYTKEQANLLEIQRALDETLQSRFSNIKLTNFLANGTLGVFFSGQIETKILFLKTHLPGTFYRENLIKEHIILKAIYEDSFDTLELVEFIVNKQPYVCLIMDMLEPLKEVPNVNQISDLLKYCEQKMSNHCIGPNSYDLRGLCTFVDILEYGKQSLSYLTQEKQLSLEISKRCDFALSLLEHETNKNSWYLCHGDLSNKNILCKGEKLILIDWEDAFWGPKEYDLLYWLTFFDQRKHYSKDLIQKISEKPNRDIAIMVLIVLVKSFISYKKDEAKFNKLSFDERILEILSLCR